MKVLPTLVLGLMAAAALSLTVAAADSPVDEASAEAALAARHLREAAGRLDTALGAQDQVVALTDMIRAYERGMGALRSGLRRAGMREQEILAEFEARRDRLGRVLGVMTAMQKSPETALLLHPAGPEATARSAMILNSIAPALSAEADELQTALREIQTVRALEEGAANTLAQGMGEVQEARRLLASAVNDRSSLPVRFGEDPVELTTLVQSADTLDAFATGIIGMEKDVGAPMGDFEGAQGSLAMPAVGTIIRQYGQADAAGVSRPGIVMSTSPAALVTTPWPATIRYRGPLLDYGNVMVIEPAQGYLLIFAGLSQVFGEVGDVLAAGEPVGLMGGELGSAQEFGIGFVQNAAIGEHEDQTETLYIELRKGKDTLDPTEWFMVNPIVGDTGQDGTTG
ncbi:peptidoglycan DD-metalloendopeptidase family protein [uncultured Paracoccus sp.]|uniref:murein hydrolase activator EnvC family protein n=1 Tax=uncultured Paracoccus sp. TaxID=189685 RepID=UPI0025D34D50|nr:peptidoglycan DD-metalloendopeptidase family protein [uncultured Paracoccus sp.]